MRTRPVAKAKSGGQVIIVIGKREVTLDGEKAVRLAHDLMKAGEKALKRAGKWKPE